MMEPVRGVGVWQQAGDQGGGVLDPGRHHQGQGGVFTRQGGATRTMEERDVLGGIWVAPEGVKFFSLQGSPCVSFCPRFHFHFREWKWNLVLHYFVLYSKQQHVNRAWAPKHVMRVAIHWEKKYRKGLLSTKRSERKVKNIMIVFIFNIWLFLSWESGATIFVNYCLLAFLFQTLDWKWQPQWQFHLLKLC